MTNGMEEGKGLSQRDLLLELRADVKSIDAKLDAKADRQRVHDLANELNVIKLERAGEKTIQYRKEQDLLEIQRDVIALKNWRLAERGGLTVALAIGGSVLAKALGAF